MRQLLLPVPVFTPQDAAIHARKAHANRAESSLAQLCEMQGALRTDIMDADTKPAERAQAMRAYIEAEKLKRVIRGQAANTSQSIKSEPVKSKRGQTTGPIESVQDGKPSDRMT